MKCNLIDYTGIGWPDPADRAASLLIFTKHTRLNMSPALLEDIASWSKEKKQKELEYMSNSIPSSWEFVSYTFMIEDVTRSFTHQFVRSRQCSFAQQSMRVTDMSEGPGWDYATGPTIPSCERMEQAIDSGGMSMAEEDWSRGATYHDCMIKIARSYKALIKQGAAVEDARGILPTNILTNIVMKCNMRTFVELVRKRSSPRTQGEYRAVLDAMIEAVKAVHPWISLFIERTFENAAKDLDAAIQSLEQLGRLSKEEATTMIKLVDQMRSQ